MLGLSTHGFQCNFAKRLSMAVVAKGPVVSAAARSHLLPNALERLVGVGVLPLLAERRTLCNAVGNIGYDAWLCVQENGSSC